MIAGWSRQDIAESLNIFIELPDVGTEVFMGERRGVVIRKQENARYMFATLIRIIPMVAPAFVQVMWDDGQGTSTFNLKDLQILDVRPGKQGEEEKNAR